METASGLVRPIAAVVVVHSIATKTWIEAAIIAAKKPVEASISAPIFVRTVRTIVESVASILRGQTIAGGTSRGKSRRRSRRRKWKGRGVRGR